MHRRDFIVGASAGLIVEALSNSSIAADREYAGMPAVHYPAGIRVPTVAEYIAALEEVKGAAQPYVKEVEKGRELIKDIPLGPTPYDVAYRFYLWRKGKVGATEQERKDYGYYAQEWPVRGNPIIMGFFDATGLRTPVGDVTPWCSAFVSWCIQRTLPDQAIGLTEAEKEKIWRYKDGAASASYRDWGDQLEEPRKGDLAVFKLNDYQGHIGFVHAMDEKIIWVLGGNQGAQDDRNGGEVNIAAFSRRTKKALKLHSFRTHALLHK